MSIKGARPNEARIALHLLVSDGERALQFYAAAFGATVLFRSPMPGRNGVHAQIRIAESTVLITTVGPASDGAHPGIGSPEMLGGSSTILELYVENVDTVYQRAVDAGATAVMPLMDTFFGDRYGHSAIRSATCGDSPPSAKSSPPRRWMRACVNTWARRIRRKHAMFVGGAKSTPPPSCEFSTPLSPESTDEFQTATESFDPDLPPRLQSKQQLEDHHGRAAHRRRFHPKARGARIAR